MEVILAEQHGSDGGGIRRICDGVRNLRSSLELAQAALHAAAPPPPARAGVLRVIGGKPVSQKGPPRLVTTSLRTAERSKVEGLELANATLLATVTDMQVAMLCTTTRFARSLQCLWLAG